MAKHIDADLRCPATILILAGGQGARMGGADKASLPWAGGTLLTAIVGRAASVAQEILVVGCETPDIPAPAARVADVFADCGPLGGLHAGLAAARFERCLALGCDMPFVSQEVMCALLDLGVDCDAAVPQAADGLHPLLATYSRRCLPRVEAQLRNGDRRMRSFFAQVNVRWITEEDLRPFDPDLRCFFNINTREDYNRALALASELSSAR